MAEQQKPIEVAETTPAVVEAAATEPVPAETTPVTAAATETAAETKPAETAAEEPAAAAEAATETPAATEDAKKEEAKPIEEGTLEHKGAGAGFPKNLMFSKTHFWFGSEAVPSEKLAAYLKSEKATEVGHHVASWATETGKGLLFYGKESDKATPHGIIPLADADEPATEGHNKFTVVAKGQKHAFKAPNTADRDNWVSQLKLKIAEAKELATTVTESETYKKTLESLKPTPAAKKEEKPAAAAETPAATEGAAATEETPTVVEPAAEAKKEETKEEPKRRSASRKRTSFFGFGKKEEAKKEEVKKEAETKNADEVAVETPAAETPAIDEAPKVEEPAKPVEEVPVVAPVTAEEPAKAAEETPAEAVPATTEEKPLESPKPTAIKRNSFFGNVFSKKEKKTPELKPTEPEAPKDAAEAETTAPVIPPVEATTPLAVDVSNPATVPTETTEAAAATSPAPEAKKDLKEKRKSSLPFAFGKRDKSPAPVEGEKKESPFSKLRNTIRGKSPKPAEKREENKEETVQEEPTEVKAEEPKTEEAPKVEEPTEAEKPKDAAPAPVVTAAA